MFPGGARGCGVASAKRAATPCIGGAVALILDRAEAIGMLPTMPFPLTCQTNCRTYTCSDICLSAG